MLLNPYSLRNWTTAWLIKCLRSTGSIAGGSFQIRSTPIFYKRKRGTEYLSSSGFGIRDGPWLRTESIIFIVCLTLLSKTTISPSVDNLLRQNNTVVTSEHAIKTERRKTKAQVIAKMKHMEETLNYHVNFFWKHCMITWKPYSEKAV